MNPDFSLHFIDLTIIGLYIVFVVWLGLRLEKRLLVSKLPGAFNWPVNSDGNYCRGILVEFVNAYNILFKAF
ncbi:MAG: hypothetical protein KAV45_05735 [Calditrichia bacterium]|jgi:hypothetical protein|nr:hypothetical protein [Calditrichia bacterium]